MSLDDTSEFDNIMIPKCHHVSLKVLHSVKEVLTQLEEILQIHNQRLKYESNNEGCKLCDIFFIK